MHYLMTETCNRDIAAIIQTLTALTLPELRHASRWHNTDFQPKITQRGNKFTVL